MTQSLCNCLCIFPKFSKCDDKYTHRLADGLCKCCTIKRINWRMNERSYNNSVTLKWLVGWLDKLVGWLVVNVRVSRDCLYYMRLQNFKSQTVLL